MKPFWRASVEQEVREEIAFHLAMTIHELTEQGMSPNDARAEAERRFGDTSTVDAECREFARQRNRSRDRAELWTEVRQDVVYALRHLRRTPTFAAVAIVTLALGIGATSAMFSALDAVVLRPLPLADADRVLVVHPSRMGQEGASSVPDYLAMRAVKEFRYTAAAVLGTGITMKTGDLPEMIDGAHVTADYFRVFALEPEVGRYFSPRDDEPGQPAVAVISHRLWISHFNGDRGVVGRSVSLDGRAHTIVGVMPASFDITTGSGDIWTPLVFTPEQATKYGEHFLMVFARLREGTTLDQARAASTAAMRSLVQRMPEASSAPTEWSVSLRRFMDELTGDYRALLLILLGAVSLVLLIACGNVANLLLARGTLRNREMAIRTALGAARARLVRQLLTESIVLGFAGALLGLVVAFGLLKLIVAVSPEDVPRLEAASIDWRVLAFTMVVSLASSIVFGLVPALRTARARMQGTLREGGRGMTGGKDRVRRALVAAEVALAITLLVGSGLLIRSAWLMQRVNPGFDPRGVLTARLILPEARYPDGASIARAYENIRANAANIPGVASAAIVSVVPLSGSSMHSSVTAAGIEPGAKMPTANLRLASAGYLATMGIPLLAGRDITPQDGASAPHVAIINQALARRLWPTLDPRDAIGRKIGVMSSKKSDAPNTTIIGIAGNIHDAGLNVAPEPEFYAPVPQAPELLWPIIQRSLVVVMKSARASTSAASLVKPLRKVVAGVDASLPVADSRTMESYLRGSVQTARMSSVLLAVLAAIALVLSMVGIYGVVSYFVSQRRQEIGLRMALGATPSLIWRFVMRHGITPVLAGVALGVGLSLAATELLREELYAVGPHDPLTLVAVAVTLTIVAVIATVIPARRAMRVAPVVALNEGAG
jgi:predicted permease